MNLRIIGKVGSLACALIAASQYGSAAEAAASQTETPEQRAESYIDEARSTVRSVSLRLTSRAMACDSEEAHAGLTKIARVDGLMQGLVNIQPQFPPYMQAGVSRAISQLGVEAGRLRLEMADGYLAGDCVAQADRLYRFVIENFSSPVFSALRQRAQVGMIEVGRRTQNGQ